MRGFLHIFLQEMPSYSPLGPLYKAKGPEGAIAKALDCIKGITGEEGLQEGAPWDKLITVGTYNAAYISTYIHTYIYTCVLGQEEFRHV